MFSDFEFLLFHHAWNPRLKSSSMPVMLMLNNGCEVRGKLIHFDVEHQSRGESIQDLKEELTDSEKEQVEVFELIHRGEDDDLLEKENKLRKPRIQDVMILSDVTLIFPA